MPHRMQRLSSTSYFSRTRGLGISAPVGHVSAHRPQTDARRRVEAHVERRRHERVEAGAHEVVAGRADDLLAHVGAAAAVDAARRLAQDERVAVVADVVVVRAREAVLGDAAVARSRSALARAWRASCRTRCPGGAGRSSRSPRTCTAGSASIRPSPLTGCTGSRTRRSSCCVPRPASPSGGSAAP